jgi:transglutaminase-like putative cysteine protease
MVRFEFNIALHYHVNAPCDFLFNVHAAHTAAQRVVGERVWSNAPGATVTCCDPHFGNRLLRVSAASGDVEIEYQATVDITHFIADPGSIPETPVGQLPAEVLPFLLPSRYCQSDRMGKFACWEFGKLAPGYARVEAIRQWVQSRTRFVVGTTTSATSALDTLAEHTGVCRDFAHLMITLCRALNIPARFVTGIDYGADPALGPVDFHAYVEAFLGDRWYLFDPTDITPTTGLLRIGTGRDAADAPFATIFGDVQSGMPELSIRAIVDPANGYLAPERTTSAVSTAGLLAHAPTLQLVATDAGSNRHDSRALPPVNRQFG